jgi:hypothetical protein
VKKPKFSLDVAIERKATRALEKLLARGGRGDIPQARKYAKAAMSWCQRLPETQSSRARGKACHRMWLRVVDKCDELLKAEK